MCESQARGLLRSSPQPFDVNVAGVRLQGFYGAATFTLSEAAAIAEQSLSLATNRVAKLFCGVVDVVEASSGDGVRESDVVRLYCVDALKSEADIAWVAGTGAGEQRVTPVAMSEVYRIFESTEADRLVRLRPPDSLLMPLPIEIGRTVMRDFLNWVYARQPFQITFLDTHGLWGRFAKPLTRIDSEALIAAMAYIDVDGGSPELIETNAMEKGLFRLWWD